MIPLDSRRQDLAAAIASEYARAQPDLETRVGAKLALKPHNGTHYLRAQDGSAVARFNLVPFPNCGAIAVLCDLLIEPAYRRVGLGGALFALQVRAAEVAQCAVILATVKARNTPMLRLFGRDWKPVAQFLNRATDNDVILMVRTIV